MFKCITRLAAVGLACLVVPVLAAKPTVEEMKQAPRVLNSSFSFVYGGKPFAELEKSWKKSTSSKKLDRNRTKRTRVYTDKKTGLVVRCVAVEYRDFPAVEWLLQFKNEGKEDTPVLENIQPLDTQFTSDNGEFTLHRALGDNNSAESFRLIDKPLKPGDPELVFAPDAGRSSEGAFPFFNLQWNDGGAVIAVGWSGQWQARYQYSGKGTLNVQAGMQHTHLKLHPGESIRTPRILMLFWKGNEFIRGNNLFRQIMMAHYMPKRNGKLVIPPICATVSNVDPDGSYEGPHLRVLPTLAKCGIEVFWSDMDPQQWYPIGFPNGTGTWDVDPVKYPRGLKPIGDAIRANGMEYLLWFEPERVHVGTRIEKEHPEYVMKREGDVDQYHSENRLFHLDNPTARKWLTDYIDTTITAAGVSWLRWDYNIQPLQYWRQNDAPDREGITEIHYIEGLYAMWDDLRARHPGLVVDNCASGGRRIDLETCMRGLPLWHSDRPCFGPDGDADQLQNAGLNMWIPMHGCGNYGYEPSYLFRSGMTAGNILLKSNDQKLLTTADSDTEDLVKRTVAIYKKLRPYMVGDFYPLFSFNTSDKVWYGYQFHRSDKHAGYAMLFRRGNCPDSSVMIKLSDIQPSARYEVTFEDSSEKYVKLGAELSQLQVTVPSASGSAIVYYRKVK